jgi:chondroitin 4-sulfotransferase 11
MNTDVIKYIIKRILYYPLYKERLKTKRYRQYFEKEVVFIHIPKAAGSSINMSLYGNMGLGHLSVREYINLFGLIKYKSLYSFTFVRNPYSRVQSAYNFLKKGGMNSVDEKFANKFIHKFEDLNDFILHGLNESEEIQRWIHFIPQYEFLFYNGKKQVDYIGKVENINKDYKYIMNVLGIKNDLETHNQMQSGNDFMQHFNDESKQVIQQLYSKDFEEFNYAK